MQKKLTFLIVNYKSAKLVTNLINNIQAFTKDISFCVVDNSNEAQFLTEGIADLKEVIILEPKVNLGYARGNNLGLRYIERHQLSKFVCICNPDIEIDNLNLLRLLEVVETANAPSVFGIKVKDQNGSSLVNHWKQPTLIEDIAGDFSIIKHPGSVIKKFLLSPKITVSTQEKQHVDIITGAFFVAKLTVIAKAGYFDDRTFLFCEERILAKRLEGIGVKRYVLETIHCKHSASTTIKKQYSSKFKRHLLLIDSRIKYYRYYSHPTKLAVYIATTPFSLLEKLIIDIILRLFKRYA
jgi:GT2 family glycosyltransferase